MRIEELVHELVDPLGDRGAVAIVRHFDQGRFSIP
jgi:hypothetical protein